jgi:hypothetical protein
MLACDRGVLWSPLFALIFTVATVALLMAIF